MAISKSYGISVVSQGNIRPIIPRKDMGWKITAYSSRYGYNNYPQICKRILENSPTGKFCRNLHVKHLVGVGFEEEGLNRTKLNFLSNGLTGKRVLRQMALSLANHNFFALHVNYNVNGQPTTITPVVPHYLRKGLQDSFGRTNKVAIYHDWLHDRYDLPENHNYNLVQYYDVFNDNPNVVREQIQRAGGIQNYKGQIFVDWGDYNVYPTAVYDPVLPQMIAEWGITLHNQDRVESNFTASQVFAFSEKFQNNEERTRINNLLAQRKQGDIVVLDGVPEGVFRNIPLNHATNEKLFSHTAESARRSIIQSFGQPFALHSEFKSGGLSSTGQEMQMAYYQYNLHTEDDRTRISEALSRVMMNYWKPELAGLKWNIQPITFDLIENVNPSTDNITE